MAVTPDRLPGRPPDGPGRPTGPQGRDSHRGPDADQDHPRGSRRRLDDRLGATGYHEAGADADGPPSVGFDPEDDRLFVRGVLVVGSSSCMEASDEAVEYEGGELHVYVLHDWKESVRDDTPRSCTDDIGTDAYEVAVTFDDGLPARVVAEVRDYHAEERRTVRER